MKSIFHQKLLANSDRVEKWFSDQRVGRPLPIYSSVDVRDGEFKVVAVDANIFPAGFNNICPVDREKAPEILRNYLNTHYGEDFKKILLVAEEHTTNKYYWENILALQKMIVGSGREVQVTVPRDLSSHVIVEASSGGKVELIPSREYSPDLVISNNDFSEAREEWNIALTAPMNPPRELGWFQRKKSRHFEFYNALAAEFADLLELDPWSFQVETELVSEFDVSSDDSRRALAARVENMFKNIANNYERFGINRKPVVFIKNNAGTYGLAVTSVSSAQEILDWSSKARKKMTAAKGGRDVEEVIIQEGVPTTIISDGEVAEPTIYMVGCKLIGGFLRAHKEKGPDESLNSPGAVYKRLCVSDLEVRPEGCPMENVYGSVARLATLAISREAEAMGVQFPKFRISNC